MGLEPITLTREHLISSQADFQLSHVSFLKMAAVDSIELLTYY
jgi:hypothetical protein